MPRDALAVLAMPSLRPVARSSVHPVKMPRSTMARRNVASPSASNGREAADGTLRQTQGGYELFVASGYRYIFRAVADPMM